jgi:hypothetical protein
MDPTYVECRVLGRPKNRVVDEYAMYSQATIEVQLMRHVIKK